MTLRNRAQREAEAIIRERRITAPRGHALCDCEPFTVDLHAGRTVLFSGAEVARLSGLPRASEGPWPVRGLAKVGELAGVLVLPPCHVIAEVSGRSWPSRPRLYAWRVQSLHFSEGDDVRLHPVRDGTLTLWSLVLAEPYIDPDRDFTARGLWELKS